MATSLSAQAVGSTVILNLNDTPTEFIVVHQGNPDPGLYDASCDGTWLMMKNLAGKIYWGSSNNYASSIAHTWLNETFLSTLDSSIQALLPTVKIPYTQDGVVHSGAEGFAAKVFLLSGHEVGWTGDSYPNTDGLPEYMPAEGACLAYFEGCGEFDDKRCASYGGQYTWHWLRSPYTYDSDQIWLVARATNRLGCAIYREGYGTYYGVRPVMILPSSLLVNDSGAVQPNTAPAITSPSGVSGTNLGIRNGPFVFTYTATDPEGASLTLTEQLDGQTTRTLTAASGSAQTFAALNDTPSFLRLVNGSHTLQVTASDGIASSSLSMTFTKAATSASLTLTQPIAVTGAITAATLSVEGSIPADADYSVEATNNALDEEPVWQDVTAEVRQGSNIVFANRTAEAGPAFNFRIKAARGESGTGGYINMVSGAFQ